MSNTIHKPSASNSTMKGGNRYIVQMQKQLTEIAKTTLRIPVQTKAERNSLAFHHLAVCTIMLGLEYAYKAGRKDAIKGSDPALIPGQFDYYEIMPMVSLGAPYEPGFDQAEPCEPTDADFWSLFGHIPGHGVRCIGDFRNKEDAEEILSRITGEDCPIDSD